MKKNYWQWWVSGAVIIVLALLGRFYRLSELPAGLHQDEAWFAYNAFLILQNGANIYGDKWPLTVDMWGDHVSAVHSYFLVPFIALLGNHTFSYRTGIVTAGLLAMMVALWWIYHETKDKVLVLIAGVMMALSPWIIVMSRSSSSVIIDTLMLVSLVALSSLVLSRSITAIQNKTWNPWLFGLMMLGLYIWTILTYATYFTSRLLIPPYLVLLGIYYWYFHQKSWSKIITYSWLALIGLYLIFPFGYFLNSPYAVGRYKETAILGSNTVKSNLTSHIAQSGQAGFPIFLTRLRYNKVVENANAFFRQYVELISPSVLLFQNGPPKRYQVPSGASLTVLEYLGLILAVGGIVFVKGHHKLRGLTFLLLLMTLLAAIPSALTEDDFPNLQRAVIMTPFVQLAAASGWFLLLKNWYPDQKKLSPLVVVGVTIVLSLPSLFNFWYGYIAQMPYERPFHRSRAGEELTTWINTNASDSKIVQDHIEGVFFYPYLFAGQDLRQEKIIKDGKYFLNSDNFWIGQRHFVKDLCNHLKKLEEDYDYYVLFTLHEKCPYTKDMLTVYEARYDDGSVGWSVYKK